jgi:hypothetical protein
MIVVLSAIVVTASVLHVTRPSRLDLEALDGVPWDYSVYSEDQLHRLLGTPWQPKNGRLLLPEGCTSVAELAASSSANELTGLRFTEATFSAEDVRNLAAFPKLRFLQFVACSFEPRALARLPKLEQLRGLSFVRSSIADADVKIVAQRYRDTLELLNVAATPISDDGVKYMTSLRYLNILNISGTKVTVASVGPFCEMRQLRELYIMLPYEQFPTDPGALQTVRKAIPSIKFYLDDEHYSRLPGRPANGGDVRTRRRPRCSKSAVCAIR